MVRAPTVFKTSTSECFIFLHFIYSGEIMSSISIDLQNFHIRETSQLTLELSRGECLYIARIGHILAGQSIAIENIIFYNIFFYANVTASYESTVVVSLALSCYIKVVYQPFNQAFA